MVFSFSFILNAFLNITSIFQTPVIPFSPGGTTPTSFNISSTLLSGISTWLATMASSYSHQPQRVNVWVVGFPSTSKVMVNFSPISGSRPSSSSTLLSVAASSVPSFGRRPSTGTQYIHLAWFSSE